MPRDSGSGRSLAAPVLGLLLVAAGCTGDGPAPPPPERPPPAGTLRLGYPEEPPTLNPVTEGAPAALDILRPVLPSFFVVTPDLRYRPYLLAGPPQVRREGDRMEVDFRIRDGARWSDGQRITVDDVAFTWRVMTDPRLDVASPDGFDHVRDVVLRSPSRGTLVLSPPLASWRDLFSAGRFVLPSHAAESPVEVEEWDGGPPVGAGPFTVGRRVPGRSVMLEANRGFFGEAPLVRRIEVTFVPDPTTALQLLDGGLLDAVAPMLGVSWGFRLGGVRGVERSSALGPATVQLAVNVDSVASAAARRGIAGAIDRRRFVEVVVRDDGRLLNGIVAPEVPGAAPAWRHYEGGGHADVRPDELSLIYTTTETLELLARFVQSELEAVGVDVELVPLDADVFRGTFLPRGRFDLALVEHRGGPWPDLGPWVRIPGHRAPITGLRDALLGRLGRGIDRGQAGALGPAQERLARLAPVLPVFQPRITMAWRSSVDGPVANPSVDGPLWNAWEWSKAEPAVDAA